MAVIGVLVGYSLHAIIGLVRGQRTGRVDGSLLMSIIVYLTAGILRGFVIAPPTPASGPSMLFAMRFLSMPLSGAAVDLQS